MPIPTRPQEGKPNDDLGELRTFAYHWKKGVDAPFHLRLCWSIEIWLIFLEGYHHDGIGWCLRKRLSRIWRRMTSPALHLIDSFYWRFIRKDTVQEVRERRKANANPNTPQR